MQQDNTTLYCLMLGESSAAKHNRSFEEYNK